MDFIMHEKKKFALTGASQVTLKEFESREKAKVEGSSLRMARSRSPQVTRPQRQTPPRSRPGAQSPPRSRPAQTPQIEQNDEMYQELHNKISSRSFNSRVAQALSTVKEVVEEKSFLNVVEVVKGGSVGKGTAIVDCEDSELVFFVKGLPMEGHQKDAAAAAFGAEHADGEPPGGHDDEHRVHGGRCADEREGHHHREPALLPGVRQLR